jgi:hypothetical protein
MAVQERSSKALTLPGGSRMDRKKAVDLGLLIALGTVGITVATRMVQARTIAGGTPGWDEASHGLQGLVILQDLLGLDFRSLWGDVFGTHFRYPFGHSTLLVPAYAIFGATWTTAVGVSAALFAVFLTLLFLAAKTAALPSPAPASPEAPSPGSVGAPLVGGILAVLLALNSPILIRQGMTMMLEMPTLVLGTTLLWLYSRALDQPEDARLLRAAGWTLSALVVTAAQYAAVWLFVVATYEAYRANALDRRAFLGWLKAVATSRAMLHPVHLVSFALLLVAVLVFVTGGGAIHAGPISFSLLHSGPPLTLGLLVVVARLSWLTYLHRKRLRERVPLRYQTLFASVVVPVVVWFFVLYPFRLTHFLNWTTQSVAPFPRSAAAFWTYYPKMLFEQAGSSPLLPIGILLLAALGFLGRGAPEKIRFLRWALLWTTAIVTLHSARQGRFIVPFLPLWIVLASATLSRRIGGISSARLRMGAVGAVGGLAIVLLGGTALGLFRERLVPLAASAFTPASLGYREILLKVTGEAVRKPSVRVLGSFAGLSHHLFEWELRHRVGLQGRELSFDLGMDAKNAGKDTKEPRDPFDHWLEGAPEELVYALEPLDLSERVPETTGSAGGMLTREAALVMRRMRDTARYTRSAEWVFPAAQLRVIEYSLVGERPAVGKRSKHRGDR